MNWHRAWGRTPSASVPRSHSRGPRGKNRSADVLRPPVVAPTRVDGSVGLKRSWLGAGRLRPALRQRRQPVLASSRPTRACASATATSSRPSTTSCGSTADGSAATGVIDLNTFYGYPAAINRTTGGSGPFVTDPRCHLRRTRSAGSSTSCSRSRSTRRPATSWARTTSTSRSATRPTRRQLDDLPRCPCRTTAPRERRSTSNCPCIGDYPHIGVDANGFYITTNEYPFCNDPGVYGNNFNGAQIYALDKLALAAGAVPAPRRAVLEDLPPVRRLEGARFHRLARQVPDSLYARPRAGPSTSWLPSPARRRSRAGSPGWPTGSVCGPSPTQAIARASTRPAAASRAGPLRGVRRATAV